MLGLLSLINASAYAQAPKPASDAIWAQTSTIVAGDKVTFVDESKKVVYFGENKAVKYTDNPSTKGIAFTAEVGKNSDGNPAGYAFKTEDGRYLTDLGSYKKQTLTPEVSWDVTGGKIKSLSSSGRYIYYDAVAEDGITYEADGLTKASDGCFMTTTLTNASCAIYKQFDVATPVFATEGGAIAVVGNSWNANITAQGGQGVIGTETSGVKIQYRIKKGDEYVNEVWANVPADGNVALDDYIIAIDEETPYTVTVEAKTLYNGGETTVKSVTYTLVQMKHVVFTATGKEGANNRIADDGTYVIDMAVADDVVGAQINGYILNGGVFTPGTSVDVADKVAFADAATAVVVSAQQARFGATLVSSKTFNIYTNALPGELFGYFQTDPQWNASPLNVVNANNVTKAWFALPVGSKYTLSSNLKKEDVKITPDGGEAVAPKAVAFKDGKLEITIPYSIKNTDYTIELPAGAFTAQLGTSEINKFSNPTALVGKLHADKAEVTFNINPDQVEVHVSDATGDLPVEFQVWPVNDVPTVDVNFEGTILDVKITDINNVVKVTGAYATKKAGTKNTFIVNLDASQIQDFIRTTEMAEPGLLVVFPANKLYSENDDQNKEEITSRMVFVEDVNFVVTATHDAEICNHEEKITINVASTGKVNTTKYYENVMQVSTVTIENEDGEEFVGTISNRKKQTNGSYNYDVAIPTIVNGDYTIHFADKQIKAFKSESTAANVDFHQYAHPNFKVTPIMGAENKSITFEVSATVGEGCDFSDGDIVCNYPTSFNYIYIDGTANANKFNYTAVKDPNRQVIVLTILNPTDAILADGNHTFRVQKNYFTAAGNVTCKNAQISGSYTVKPWVRFSTDDYNLVRIDTDTKDVTFPVYLKQGTSLKEYNGADLKAGTEMDGTIKLTYNDGAVSKEATITKVVNTGKDGKYMVTATLEAALQARANNYELYVAKNALWADNFNAEDFSVSFKVYNHIEISAVSPLNITTTDTEAAVVLKGWDTVDEFDATVNLKLANDDVKFLIDGQEVETAAKEVNNVIDFGQFIVSLGDGLAEGQYTITIPAESIIANASTNPEALTVQLNVEDFEAEDVTIAYLTTKFDVKVSPYAVTVANEDAVVTFANTSITGTLSESTEEGYVTVTTSAALPAKSNYFGAETYVMTIPVGAIHGKYADNSKALSCNVNVEKVLDFADDAEDGNYTKPSDVFAYEHQSNIDKVNYSRNFTGKMQPFAVPFDFHMTDELSEKIELYRVVTIAEGQQVIDGVPTVASALYIDPVEVGDPVFGGRPYIVKAKESGDFKFTFEEVNIATDLGSNDIKFSSTQKVYYSTVNMTDDVYNCKDITGAAYETAYRLSGGVMKRYADKNINIYTWRWGILSEDSSFNPYYMPMVIGDSVVDEDGEVTGIKFTTSDEAATGIYNLNGQKLNKVVKGVNIVNGKKIVVK